MSTLIRWEPARDIPMLRDRMDRMFNEMLGRNFGQNWGGEEGLATGVWVPQVDVFETPDNIVLKADLPDVKKEDVEISIQNNTLTLKGERKMEHEAKDKQVYRLERSYGAFSRSFSLPPTVDSERANAQFANGVLTLTLPRREEAKPKQIKVKVNG